MAVDLGDLIEPLRAAVNPPGRDLFPNATEEDWLLRLSNGFWEARLANFFSGYREVDGEIVPETVGVEDMPRELQQLIVLYAAYQVVWAELRNMRAAFRAVAGPVQYETQNAATVLRDLLKDIQDRIKHVLVVLEQQKNANVNTTVVFDAVMERTNSLGSLQSWFVR